MVTTPTAPESFSACPSSSSLTRKSSGVTTAPARHAAVYVIRTSGQLAISTSSRSPGRTPRPASPVPSLAARSASCPLVCHVPSYQRDS